MVSLSFLFMYAIMCSGVLCRVDVSSLPTQQMCISLCPSTAEYNPVCGSDGIQYFNPSRLLCAQYCGVVVDLAGTPPCKTVVTTTTPPSGWH